MLLREIKTKRPALEYLTKEGTPSFMFDLSGMTCGLQRTVMMLGFDWNFFFVIIQSVLIKLMII